MAWTSESLPTDTMKTLLDTYWKAYEDTSKPEVLIANWPDAAEMRFDLREGDKIIIMSDVPEQIYYRGNITYIDRIHHLTIGIWTMKDRQRLRDIYKMVRAILLDRKHNFTSWQLIRMQQWTEITNQEMNIWRGELKVQLENHAVLADTLV